MKHLIFLLCLFLSAELFSQPPSGKAKKGSVYGKDVTAANATTINKLPEQLKGSDTVAVKVEGKVLDVCKAKGCWMTMQVNDSTEAFVKMQDYGFFVPTDLVGKNVLLEGRAFVKTTSVEDLKHYAEDAGKSPEEIEKIKGPEKQIRLIASGIKVK